MARGGARPGSGRKKGGANKKTREVADAAAKAGVTPLEYLLSVMRSGATDVLRFEAAKAAAPYIHPRLSTVNANHNGQVAVSVTIVSEFDE